MWEIKSVSFAVWKQKIIFLRRVVLDVGEISGGEPDSIFVHVSPVGQIPDTILHFSTFNIFLWKSKPWSQTVVVGEEGVGAVAGVRL